MFPLGDMVRLPVGESDVMSEFDPAAAIPKAPLANPALADPVPPWTTLNTLVDVPDGGIVAGPEKEARTAVIKINPIIVRTIV